MTLDTQPITIREATPNDIGLVLGLIHEKAAFDGVPDWVEATEDLLREALFGPRPAAFVFLGELNGRVVGFAICFFTFSSFLGRRGIWLDDLFVLENARGNGVGGALLTHLGKLADAMGYARIEWVTAVDNAKGLAFYRRNGAQVQERVQVLRMGRDVIAHLAFAGTASLAHGDHR